MTLELVNTFATLGTFVVIAATAIAAIVQLRHARSGNQIAALNELRESYERTAFVEAQHFLLVELADRMKDAEFRYQVGSRAARSGAFQPDIAKLQMIGNFYEVTGLLVKTGIIERRLVLEIWSGLVLLAWNKLAPATAILRRSDRGIWENFEYLAVLAQDWVAAHPRGNYPAGMRRIDLDDEWLEGDRQHAASRTPA